MEVFVDANCFKGYIDSVMGGVNSICRSAFEHILSVGHISLDSGGIFKQEWCDCTGANSNIFINDHIADLMISGSIVLREFVNNHSLKKSIRQLGVPKKDRRIIEFCVGASVEFINSNDIDLYQPAMKGCTSAQRQSIVHERKGTICRHVEKELGIIICCCCRVPELIN